MIIWNRFSHNKIVKLTKPNIVCRKNVNYDNFVYFDDYMRL